jgi:hypothetical protein
MPAPYYYTGYVFLKTNSQRDSSTKPNGNNQLNQAQST